MTVQYSKYSECMIAQCDQCLNIVEFDELKGRDKDDWSEVKTRIDMDGWQSRCVNGKWQNVCGDCVS